MNILHVAPIDDKLVSGIRTSAPSLASAQNETGWANTALLTTGHGALSDEWPIPVYFADRVGLSGSLSNLPKPFNQPDLVIFHSTYILKHLLIGRWLRRRGIPYIITPRGGMTPIAQKVSQRKKTVANSLGFGSFFRGALGFHCLNELEARGSAKWGKPTFIATNAVKEPADILPATPGTRDTLRFIFIGRMDVYHKGLDVLMGGVALIREELIRNRVTVELYGPDFKNGFAHLQDMILELKLSDIVEVHGALNGTQKFSVLSEGDLFLHTSRLEGWPLSILEAMIQGLPCLVTHGTNLGESIAESRAGWVVDENAEAIATGLLAAIQSKEELAVLGARARTTAQDQFSWEKVAALTLDEYRNLLSMI
jgi:glycosyltransferase involved in cell wall biosynthesis